MKTSVNDVVSISRDFKLIIYNYVEFEVALLYFGVYSTWVGMKNLWNYVIEGDWTFCIKDEHQLTKDMKWVVWDFKILSMHYLMDQLISV